MTDNLPELPETDWMLHMPAKQYEPEWTSNQEGFDADQMRSYALSAIASERARADALEAALLLAVHAMRAPLDDWKGELERKALDAARSLLEKTNDRPFPIKTAEEGDGAAYQD